MSDPIDALRREHQPWTVDFGIGGGVTHRRTECQSCRKTWPCLTDQVLDSITDLEAELSQANADLALLGGHGPDCPRRSAPCNCDRKATDATP